MYFQKTLALTLKQLIGLKEPWQRRNCQLSVHSCVSLASSPNTTVFPDSKLITVVHGLGEPRRGRLLSLVTGQRYIDNSQTVQNKTLRVLIGHWVPVSIVSKRIYLALGRYQRRGARLKSLSQGNRKASSVTQDFCSLKGLYAPIARLSRQLLIWHPVSLLPSII